MVERGRGPLEALTKRNRRKHQFALASASGHVRSLRCPARWLGNAASTLFHRMQAEHVAIRVHDERNIAIWPIENLSFSSPISGSALAICKPSSPSAISSEVCARPARRTLAPLSEVHRRSLSPQSRSQRQTEGAHTYRWHRHAEAAYLSESRRGSGRRKRLSFDYHSRGKTRALRAPSHRGV